MINDKINTAFLGIFLCLLNFSCYSKKETKILGYAYEGDIIIIKKGTDTLLNFKIEGNKDSNSICSFYKEFDLYSGKQQIQLTVIVDSNNVNVLDSFVIISRDYKKPYISLSYPDNKKRTKRLLFVADEGDSTFHKF